jgi:hypothetical protein
LYRIVFEKVWQYTQLLLAGGEEEIIAARPGGDTNKSRLFLLTNAHLLRLKFAKPKHV